MGCTGAVALRRVRIRRIAATRAVGLAILVAVDETRPTEQQDDSAAQLARREVVSVAHLRVVLGRCASEIYEIPSTGVTLGRDASDSTCDVRVDDLRMSRQHGRIERNRSGWQLVDLGSRNGGFVDGLGLAPQQRVTLDDGAVIRLGDTLFVFRLSLPATDARGEDPVFPGVSAAAARVRRRIDALAAGSGHVLILGETGTGKERVSRAIASRATRFVALNCAELRRELVRSELFGHLRNTFSGATHDKVGLVETAGKGVLFLDEIGELAPDVQADLLRYLEDGSFRPIGATELRHSDARVVAATNVDLDQAVMDGDFRRDLAARLRASNQPLELPPLRARREDIPRWANLFLREAGYKGSDSAWTVGTLECFLLYPWLENLRELRGAIRGLIADTVSFPCPTDKLPRKITDHRGKLRSSSTAEPTPDATPPARDPTQAEIEAALQQTQGRVRTAARQLGIERRKLYRLCERFGIALEDHRAGTQQEDE
jgi:DNA-binding NtrC family response regulator